jgi:hypothetical protein
MVMVDLTGVWGANATGASVLYVDVKSATTVIFASGKKIPERGFEMLRLTPREPESQSKPCIKANPRKIEWRHEF